MGVALELFGCLLQTNLMFVNSRNNFPEKREGPRRVKPFKDLAEVVFLAVLVFSI